MFSVNSVIRFGAKMLLNILRGAGTVVRFAILPVASRQHDRDKLDDPVIRKENTPINRVLEVFERT